MLPCTLLAASIPRISPNYHNIFQLVTFSLSPEIPSNQLLVIKKAETAKTRQSRLLGVAYAERLAWMLL